MNRLFVSVFVAALALGIAPTRAGAQPAKPSPAAPLDASLAEARARFNEGIVLADAGNHEGARLKFNQAWGLLKSPAVLYNLARAEQLSGHTVDALEHYRLFGRMATTDPKVTETERQRASENVAELSKRVGQIDVEAPKGAHVSVDGRAVESSTGDPIPVSPGKHVVEATAAGKVKSVTVDCTPGTVTKARLLDDREATTATAAPPLATAPIPSPRATSADKPDAPSDTTRNVLGLSLGTAAVVAGVVGLGFFVDANGAVADANDFTHGLPGGACASRTSLTCSQYAALRDEASSSRTGSWVGFALTGAFALAAAAVFVLWPTAPRVDRRHSSL